MDSKELVDIRNEQVVTTSIQVAQYYERKHKSVLESIRKTIDTMPADRIAHLFEESTYLDAQGKPRPMYYMNRDGYSLLVMTFEGKKAAQFRLAYMDAFNYMEKQLKEQQSKALTTPTSGLDFLQAMLDNMKEQNAKILAVEKRLDSMEEEKKEATDRLLSSDQYLSKEFAPIESERDSIRRLVNDYSTSTGIKQQDVWHKVYADLYYTYHININTHLMRPGEKSKLDVAQRIGAIPKIHSIISTMVYNLDKKQN